MNKNSIISKIISRMIKSDSLDNLEKKYNDRLKKVNERIKQLEYLREQEKKLKEEESKKVSRIIEKYSAQKYKIFVDLDGVLTDFGESLRRIGIYRGPGSKLNNEEWEQIKRHGEMWWSEMGWMEDGRYLWDYVKIHNPEILSSPAGLENAKKGKRVWVKNNLGEEVKVNLERARNKKKLSGKNHVLIDNEPQNIKDWIEAGGIGILHTSTDITIRELKKLGL